MRIEPPFLVDDVRSALDIRDKKVLGVSASVGQTRSIVLNQFAGAFCATNRPAICSWWLSRCRFRRG